LWLNSILNTRPALSHLSGSIVA